MSYAELFRLLVPETIVIIAAFVALLIDFVSMRDERHVYRNRVVGAFAAVGCVAAIAWISQAPDAGNVLNGMLSITPLTQLVKQAILGLTVFTIIISLDSKFTQHVGEYFALLLLASAGMMLLVSSENLLMLFVSLELVSLSLYAMAAFNKASLASAEGALKYFLFGGMSAAFTLFGLSLIYGFTGEIDLAAIAQKLTTLPLEPIFYVGLVMTLVGFGFKIAAAPFHLWAPDAYQGAPTPVASFIASGSKVASFFVLARILFTGFNPVQGSAAYHDYAAGWTPVLVFAALASMLIGNLAAIVQSSVKRLIAYSAIAHAGYALLAFLSPESRAFSALLFYVITYGLSVVGAFAVIGAIENAGGGEKLADFAGLSRRSPLLSICMLVFMLSLAGIPPLSGFFGKFYVFTAAAGGAKDLGFLWLVIFAIATSAISLYYYLQVLKQIYVAKAPATTVPLQSSFGTSIAIAVLAGLVVLLGCAPGLLLGKLTTALAVVHP